MFQACGWLYPTICFTLIAGISIWAGLFLTKAISRVEGNAHLEKRVEYNEVTQNYLPRWAYLISMTALLFNFQASNSEQQRCAWHKDAAWQLLVLPPPPPCSQQYRSVGSGDGLDASRDSKDDVRHCPLPAAKPAVRVHHSVGRPHHGLSVWRQVRRVPG